MLFSSLFLLLLGVRLQVGRIHKTYSERVLGSSPRNMTFMCDTRRLAIFLTFWNFGGCWFKDQCNWRKRTPDERGRYLGLFLRKWRLSALRQDWKLKEKKKKESWKNKTRLKENKNSSACYTMKCFHIYIYTWIYIHIYEIHIKIYVYEIDVCIYTSFCLILMAKCILSCPYINPSRVGVSLVKCCVD